MQNPINVLSVLFLFKSLPAPALIKHVLLVIIMDGGGPDLEGGVAPDAEVVCADHRPQIFDGAETKPNHFRTKSMDQ